MTSEHLKALVTEIREDREILRLDETSTKQAIIFRVLHMLGWDTFNRKEVVLEYGLDTTKVDIALFCADKCHVLIEAKKAGEDLDKHQEQLLNYSFKKGVELAVLTNGLSWWFYLPTKNVDWRLRKFYAIDLLRQDINDIERRFNELLDKNEICGGATFRHAEQIFESRRRKLQTDAFLPKAWNKIIQDQDALLVELISETTESLCGLRPDETVVVDFLKRHSSKLLVEESPQVRQKNQPPQNQTTQHIETIGSYSPPEKQKRDHDPQSESAAYAGVKEKIGRLGSKLSGTRSWFQRPNGDILILRYSKRHITSGYDQYFFGLQRDKFESLKNSKIYIVLICGTSDKAIILPPQKVSDIFRGVRTADSDDNWKFSVFERNGIYEISLTGKPREDLTGLLNKYEMLHR